MKTTLVLAVATNILLIGLVGCSTLQKNELEGKWLSNKEKTISYIESTGLLTAEQRAFLEPRYGKLMFEATPDEVTISWTDGLEPTRTVPYTYTKDGNRYTVNVDGQQFVYTIEGDCMWVAVDQLKQGMREYFCKVPTP